MVLPLLWGSSLMLLAVLTVCFCRRESGRSDVPGSEPAITVATVAAMAAVGVAVGTAVAVVAEQLAGGAGTFAMAAQRARLRDAEDVGSPPSLPKSHSPTRQQPARERRPPNWYAQRQDTSIEATTICEAPPRDPSAGGLAESPVGGLSALLLRIALLRITPVAPSIIASVMRRQRRFCTARLGVVFSPADLMSTPGIADRRFVTSSKACRRDYGTRLDGDRMKLSQVLESDRYYVEDTVIVDGSACSMPLILDEVMKKHDAARQLVMVLQRCFVVDRVTVFINGASENVTATHFDTEHNVIMVLWGSCVFYTAPHHEIEPDEAGSGWRLGMRENESSKAPNGEGAECFAKHSMNAGGVAVQPGGMWHHVWSSPWCVKVAIFFRGD